jgi:ABC-type sugar transport system permease subunit
MATTAAPRRNALRRAHGLASRRNPSHRNDWKLALLLIAPAVLGFVVFAVYPTLRGIYLSFTDFQVLSPPEWTGLENLQTLMGDKMFWQSLGITWQWMLDPQLGIINIGLEALTGERIKFLSSPEWVIPSVAAISVWKSMGYNAILIVAGLSTIPNEVYEAGRLDGASEIQMFRRLTIPLLRPILAMVIVLTVISAFQVFDIVAVTTKGGPANSSNVLQMYIYDKAFNQFDFGYAATMSLSLFVMLIAITFLQMRLLRADESDTN